MRLVKRNCPVKMRLVPYGGGWTDVYVDFGDGELYFIISDGMGDDFDSLMKSLYYLYPNQDDPFEMCNFVDCKCGKLENVDGELVVTRIVDYSDEDEGRIERDVPWKADFEWCEEGASSCWKLERVPDLNESFILKVSIDVFRDEKKHYEYEIAYEDMCYAVADACTKAIKKHGFWGYHYSTHYKDMNLRYLLFLKSIALKNMEARELKPSSDENKCGEISDLQKELELLLFDM